MVSHEIGVFAARPLISIVRHPRITTAMDNENGYIIPAASIGDINLSALAQTNPVAAKEIARLEDLMIRGEETKEEFLRLCQLLFKVGAVAESEYLLRRNVDYYEGESLYGYLFGTAKQDEFEAAIEAFKSQFNLKLTLTKEHAFLFSTFHSEGGPPRTDAFALLSRPCEIEIGYIKQERIEADVTLIDPGGNDFEADEWILMYFVNGVWEIADTMDA